MFKKLVVGIIGAFLIAATANAAPVVWGGFSNARINYPEGCLACSAHSTLQSIIAANNGTVGPMAINTLTAAYLSGVDVFYTSLLDTTVGVLSASEQATLQNWVDGGGTLIVTADIFPLAGYESFTSAFGITGYTALSNSDTGTTVAAHPITQGVTSFSYVTEATFGDIGGQSLLLGINALGDDFMRVLEPATGFITSGGGRILVLGDHNLFTDSFIGNADNSLLANNIALWAANSAIAVAEPTATLAILGLGLAGLGFARRKRTI